MGIGSARAEIVIQCRRKVVKYVNDGVVEDRTVSVSRCAVKMHGSAEETGQERPKFCSTG